MAKEKCCYDNTGFVMTEKNVWLTKVSCSRQGMFSSIVKRVL